MIIPISKTIEKEVGGDTFQMRRGRICTVISHGRKVKIHQEVSSTGRYPPVKKGVVGTVIEIARPDEDGRTSNIFRVKWEGIEHPCWMTLSDFE